MSPFRFLLIPMLVLLASCSSQARKPSLFLELGGVPGITQVVDGLLSAVENDDRIVDLFDGVDLNNLRHLVIEQICDATGGNCSYSGRSMPETHEGLAITDEEFDIFVEHLVAAMNQAGVPADVQSRLASALLPMRGDIVGK
jgi:hemoglobin